MAPTVVLITGANRGLGFGLAERFLAQPDHILIAAVRDPSHPTVANLRSAPTGPGSRLVVAKYDAAVERSPFDVVASITAEHGVHHLDVVVANAAIATAAPAVRDVGRADLLETYAVNVASVVSLFQATRVLLEKAWALSSQSDEGVRNPVFAIMGSQGGVLGAPLGLPNGVYGPSKAAAHWLGVYINIEEEWLSAVVIDPGFVQTDMGNGAAELWGLAKASITPKESCDGMFKVLTEPDSKTKFGGKLVKYTGKILPW